MIPKKLEGVIIAMPTPLLENEDIDSSSLCKLIDYCIAEGANGIMIGGSMGEGPALIDPVIVIDPLNGSRIALIQLTECINVNVLPMKCIGSDFSKVRRRGY